MGFEMTPDDWKQAADLLVSWKRTLILTHDRPDGDALGAVAAMNQIIGALGGDAVPLLYDAVPARYCFLDHVCSYTNLRRLPPEALAARFDGVLVVDTCSWAQLEPIAPWLQASTLPRIIVDHHATRDDLRGAAPQALYLIDATAASACGVLYEWAEQMRWPLDGIACEALFSGMATDTGWFRFSNTDGRTLRAAAALIDAGVRPDLMYSRLIESYSPARLRLMSQVLATLELHGGDTIAVMTVTRDMFDRAGATPSDTEDIVNEPMGVSTVAVSILLSDAADGVVRVNLRSKSPEVVPRTIDVAAVARTLGGGGHQRAAGVRLTGSLEEVHDRVLSAVHAAFALQSPG